MHFFNNSSKSHLYKYAVDTFSLQYYLKKSVPDSVAWLTAIFRMSSHQLFIEQGRYNNTIRSQRICQHCNLHEIEDEFHFILVFLH